MNSTASTLHCLLLASSQSAAAHRALLPLPLPLHPLPLLPLPSLRCSLTHLISTSPRFPVNCPSMYSSVLASCRFMYESTDTR